jgi:low temperature requirement protein LtrA
LADGEARTALWLTALVIDYSGPITLYWLPGVPNVRGDTWQVGSHHFAERFGLFVIIALGESIIITGATTAELELDTKTIAAFSAAFIGTATLWWLYFTNVRRYFERALTDTSAHTRTMIARDVFTYGHVLIIAAIILVAVGDELVIAHPTETLSGAELLAVVAGPTGYLLAQLALRLRLTGQLSRSRTVGAASCILVGVLASGLPSLAVLGLLIGVLVAVAVSDQLTSTGRGAAIAQGTE